MQKDDSGQFIILMSIVVAIGMVVLLVLLNQSLMAGHSSSESIMSFPKDDIREFRAETVEEASGIVADVNANNSLNGIQRQANFNGSFNRYIGEVKDLYAENGAVVDVSYSSTVNASNLSIYQLINTTTLNMYYSNGETTYNETTNLTIRGVA
ncbi:MAG TPA: hypothetical protein VMC61_02980 [Methanocella sp.]|nr:hypothetical protein [Methanocella sp.]